MGFLEVFVRRPVFTTMIIATLVVLGLASFWQLGVDIFPKVDLPTITITTRLPGASPEEIESQITKPSDRRAVGAGGWPIADARPLVEDHMHNEHRTRIDSFPEINVTRWDLGRLDHLLGGHSPGRPSRVIEFLVRKLMAANVMHDADIPPLTERICPVM